MKKFILAMAVVSAGVFIFAVESRAQGVKEGKWAMTMTTKMEGMAQESAEAMKEMENMTPEEAAMMKQMMGKMNMNLQMSGNGQGMTTSVTQCISGQNPVPDVNKLKDCKETHSIDGNTVNFSVICSDSNSTGQVTYQDDSMEGTVQSHQVVDGKEVNATVEIRGKYVGPCS